MVMRLRLFKCSFNLIFVQTINVRITFFEWYNFGLCRGQVFHEIISDRQYRSSQACSTYVWFCAT